MTKYNYSNAQLPSLRKWHHFAAPDSKMLFLLLLILTVSSFKLFAQDPGKGATRAGFEIDADFKSGFIPTFWTASNYDPPSLLKGDDWSKGATGNAVLKQSGGVSVPGVTDNKNAIWQVDGNSGSNSAVAEGSTFSGSSNKNGDNIAPGQKPYLVQLGGSTPQKNDLTNTYLHGRTVGGQLWIFYAAETRSVNGASYVDFEYNQNGVQVVQNGTAMNLQGPANDATKKIINGRTVGDILLVINYTGGGNRPVVGIRTWQDNGTWSNELSLANTEAFVTTNTTNVDPVAPNMAFTGDGAYSNVTGALQMVEGGVNITSLNLGSNFDPCNPLSTVTIKTRSSPSYTSELKDYDILKFSAVPPATMTDISPVTKCEGQTATFSTNFSGDGTLSVKWYKVTGTAPNEVETEITTGIVTTSSNSTLTISNVTTASAGKYRAKLIGATCGAPSTTSTLTVNTTAALTNLTAQVRCPGVNETAVFSTTVSGTGALASNVEWYLGTTKLSNGTKYTIALNGSTSTLTINGIVAADAGTYTAKLVNATCGAPEKSGTLTVNPVPTANAGNAPAAQCYSAGGNTFSLSGSGSNGTPSWAVAPSGNPNNFTVVITNGTTYAPSVKVTTGVSGGTVTLRLTVTSDQTPPCGNKTSDVTVTVLPQAAGPNVTYIPPTCLESTFKVTVDNPVSGSTYTLRQLSGGVSLVTKSAPADVVGGKITFDGLTVGKGYRVTETNSAGCVSAPNTCGDFSAIPAGTALANLGKIQEQEIMLNSEAKTKVLAAPNPFNDRIRFTLKSAVSGQGSLELYNMLGQRVKTVFQGYVNANQVQTIEYAVPGPQRSNLIYLFRVGNEKTTGKLIGLKQ